MNFIDNCALGCATSLIRDSLCAVGKTMEEKLYEVCKGKRRAPWNF